MSQTLWRIATDAPAYEADDLTGAGAEITGGRWNEKGVPMVYTSETRALACLETVVHLNAGGLPLNRYLVAIEVPDDLMAAALRETAASLRAGWDAEPAGRVTLKFGTDWINARSSAVLAVPSVIVPEEINLLINPLHAEASRITARKVRRWTYDPRLVKVA
ncbi:MAG: RES family NAD+ phosphorylase [Phenylobacterium sp.]|uniref:RES family NAD+ phosphorylase n=1 Tax=Phenylobacterium sp. TaxID=1871053 RepID=UPI002736D703|nr:RES family NAD+ phosphorylase [Phenylobacterium sp.]MDP3746716.1 RES family NAD+ phosphorylase [Phenylobacterium sp.]